MTKYCGFIKTLVMEAVNSDRLRRGNQGKGYPPSHRETSSGLQILERHLQLIELFMMSSITSRAWTWRRRASHPGLPSQVQPFHQEADCQALPTSTSHYPELHPLECIGRAVLISTLSAVDNRWAHKRLLLSSRKKCINLSSFICASTEEEKWR